MVVLQNRPASHDAFTVEPSGQKEPRVQFPITEGVEQNDPAGHLLWDVDDAGQ